MTRKDDRPAADRLYEMALRNYGREQTESARALCDACLEFCPDHVDAWLLQAEAHSFEDRETAALSCLIRAANIEPPSPEALSRLTSQYLRMGRPLDAVSSARRHLEYYPGDPETDYALAVALSRAGRREEALSAFQKFLAVHEEDTGSAIEAAWLLLGERRYRQGWPLWEKRPLFAPFPATPDSPPHWRGEALAGRKILVVPEGGHGDTIWAARFLPCLKTAGAEVHVQTRPALSNLFKDLEGVDAWVEETGPQAAYDFWVPILSLPSLLQVDDPARYPPAKLHAEPAQGGGLEKLLARARAPLRVGIVWSGNVDYGGNADRAARLTDFLPLSELPYVQLYSLQKGPPQRELIEGSYGDLIIDCDDFDFSETAALIGSLDLIVMTDSAVAHIAGSLGTPVWVLLDRYSHWFHGFEGSRSDWYPAMRFFRQSQPRQWNDVISRIREELADFAGKRRNT